jgi:hypothetical protein
VNMKTNTLILVHAVVVAYDETAEEGAKFAE